MTKNRLHYLKEFLHNRQGAKWHKVNLHVHARGQKPDDIVDAAINAGISLIAITDHNTFNFVKPVQDAALKKTGDGLIVLPGIEITLEEGAHIIAIFDTDFNVEKQQHFIGLLELPINASENNAVNDKTCSKVLINITNTGGITIVPHPYTNNIGFLDKARKISTKMSWLESGNIGLIQIDDEKVKFIGFDENSKWQNRYILKTTPPSMISSTDYCLAPITPGEAQTAKEIENGSVWLKLGSRSVRGLRQVTCEPRTCISKDQPADSKSYKLLGLNVEGGFFDSLKIGFSPDFTCIIGENHSGKTAIFDFISFALGRDLSALSITEREEEREILLHRLNAILQPHSKVDLYYTQNDNSYCISRTFIPEYDKKTQKVISIQNDPEVLEYGPDKDALVPVAFQENTNQPEIYTQGHVGILRKSVVSQLLLIDDLAGLTGHRKERKKLKEKLNVNAEDLAVLYNQLEQLTGAVGNLKPLNEDLTNNEKHLKATGNTLWQNTETLIHNINNRTITLEKKLNDEVKADIRDEWKINSLIYNEKEYKEPEILGSISKEVDTYNKSIESIIQQFENSITNLKENCTPLFIKWDKKYSTHKLEVSKLLREKGFDSPEQLLNTVEDLRQQIKNIEENEVPKLDKIESQIKTLEENRLTLLNQLKATSEIIAKNRSLKIDELNQIVGPDITISIENPDPKNYFELLKTVYDDIASQEHRIQKRDEQLGRVSISVTPSELVEAILNNGNFIKPNGKSANLVDVCGITQNTQDVLCSISGVSRTLHKLQVFEPEPVPKILVKREGTDKFADLLTELSPGEQSSTILALALMARDMPLIIDQPEDELGYSYIVNKIVPKILKAKKERQVILISHNANIPVLADAEYLIKIRNDPVESQPKCTIEESGTFAKKTMCDKLLELEGGERAFQVRQYRYAIPRREGIY